MSCEATPCISTSYEPRRPVFHQVCPNGASLHLKQHFSGPGLIKVFVKERNGHGALQQANQEICLWILTNFGMIGYDPYPYSSISSKRLRCGGLFMMTP